MIYEVFRQERKGQPFQHAGSVEAADDAFADVYAREQFGRRGESAALWIVPRSAVMEIHEFVDELKSVVTGHGPKSQDRIDLRRMARENSAWVREVVLQAA